VEIWECGIAHPGVLAPAGLAGHGGLALGMGLDRMLMLVKGIPDIRLLRSADPRIAGQMRDLAAYQPVSSMPPVVRDLEKTLTNEAANVLRDRIYLAVHQGTQHQWARPATADGTFVA